MKPSRNGKRPNERHRKNSVASAPVRPGRNGGQLRSGNPGNKGGSRAPKWLEDWCDDLLADPGCKAAVEKVAKDPKHKAFVAMWKAIADRAHGKPKQAIEHSGRLTLEDLNAGRRPDA